MSELSSGELPPASPTALPGAFPARTDGYLPIEDYAPIGDGRALALVGADGAIDWMCVPDLDSPSVFAALLDQARGGRFEVAPAVPFSASRRYLEQTNVLETTFHTEGGQVRLVDALTIDKSETAPWRELVRALEGVTGTVPMRWRLEPRFGYGQRAAQFERHEDTLLARDDGLQLGLRTWDTGRAEIGRGWVGGEFELGQVSARCWRCWSRLTSRCGCLTARESSAACARRLKCGDPGSRAIATTGRGATRSSAACSRSGS